MDSEFFNMIHPHDGQLSPPEREILYKTVIESKPQICLECGTWKGLGSTFYIASALMNNNNGAKLFTYEVDKEFYDIAVERINNYGLQSYVSFHLQDYLKGYKSYNFPNVDFVFLDGPDDPDYTLTSLIELESLVSNNKYVILHDWNQTKCEKVKTYLQTSNNWILDTYVHSMAGMMRLIRRIV